MAKTVIINPQLIVEIEFKNPSVCLDNMNRNGSKKKTQIEVLGGQYNTDPAERFSFNGLNFRTKYGAKILELPFNIKLRDFQLERYPGSQSAMSYASEVTVIDPSETFDFRIYMNNILDYKGYKFFQSSFSYNPCFTIYCNLYIFLFWIHTNH